MDLKCKMLGKKRLHFRFVEIDIPFAFGIFVRLTTRMGSIGSCIGNKMESSQKLFSGLFIFVLHAKLELVIFLIVLPLELIYIVQNLI